MILLIYDAVVTKGATPSSKSLGDVVTAIGEIPSKQTIKKGTASQYGASISITAPGEIIGYYCYSDFNYASAVCGFRLNGEHYIKNQYGDIVSVSLGTNTFYYYANPSAFGGTGTIHLTYFYYE